VLDANNYRYIQNKRNSFTLKMEQAYSPERFTNKTTELLPTSLLENQTTNNIAHSKGSAGI
jgi:hypothetical protein